MTKYAKNLQSGTKVMFVDDTDVPSGLIHIPATVVEILNDGRDLIIEWWDGGKERVSSVGVYPKNWQIPEWLQYRLINKKG